MRSIVSLMTHARPPAECLLAAAMLLAAPARAHDMDAGSMPADTAAGDSLPALIARALRLNPALVAGSHEVRALHNSPEHAWHLDAPQVGVEFYQAPLGSFPNPLRRQMEIDYSIQQALPFPGKIGKRIRAEHGHARRGEAELEAEGRRVARDVKAAYYALYLAEKRRDLNARAREWAGRIIDAARRRYEVGIGTQSEVLRAQSEATRLRMDSIGLDQDRLAIAADLNAMADRDPGRAIAMADTLPPHPGGWSPERVGEAAGPGHPDRKIRLADIEARQAEASLASSGWLPDFTVGGAYKDMRTAPAGSHGGEPGDAWSVMAAMTLPIAPWSLRGTRAGQVQAEALEAKARAELRGAQRNVASRARTAAYAEAAARERLRLATEILRPQARQARESALAAYQGGNGGFPEALDAYRGDLAAQEECEAALAALLTAQAELEAAAGMDLDGLARKAGGMAR